MYEDGRGVPQDYTKAKEWIEKSAIQGYTIAQFHLALMYEAGKGVSQDYIKAKEWYEKSSERGSLIAQSQNNIGILYRDGKGVPKDPTRAKELFEMSAKQDFPIAQNNLGQLYKIEQDYTKAKEWFEKPAEQGYPNAQLNLGGMHIAGQGFPKNVDLGLLMITKASESGLVNAHVVLGMLYSTDTYLPKDFVQSYKWTAISMEMGAESAFHRLEDIAKDMSSQQIETAKELATDWIKAFKEKNETQEKPTIN